MAFVLEAKNVSKRYGKVQALQNIDLQLEDREILALVGDNGAGKSTLIKVLAGAVAKDSGEIYVDGKKVEIDSPLAAKQLGIEVVYQDLALINYLNVAQNLFLGRELHKRVGFLRVLDHRVMEQQAKEKLSDLGVRVKSVKAWVAKLSGGQRQSIAVARAASFGRKIVILDEPTAALGVRESQHVLQIVRELKTKGASVIIITHNMEHAFSVADRFMVIRLGQVVGVRKRSETDIDDIVKMITGGVFVTEDSSSR
ncbi:sugar ABC transporter ATP-binding protein [Candidatus Bipolaricaulota bacterium]|nr:sugar ABC transporter ATP-binding protein [Candidatus Bipolaricaulota bacterium]